MTDAQPVVTRFWDAWARHDLDGIMEVYADDAELTVPGAPVARGTEAIRWSHKGFMEAFPDERATLRHVSAGGTVVTEWRLTATNTGTMPLPDGHALPATGRAVDLPGVFVFDVEGGKVRRHACYHDNAELLQQLGLLPTPA